MDDTKKSLKKYFPKFLTASVVIHGLIVATTTWVSNHPYFFEAPKVQHQTVEIEFAPEPKKPEDIKSKQIVDQDTKPLNTEKPLKEAFLSRHDQRVEKETVASHKGEFQNVKSQTEKTVTSPNLAEQLRAKPSLKAVDKPIAKEKQDYIKEGSVAFDPFGEIQRGITQKSFEDAAAEKVQQQKKADTKASSANVSQSQDYVKNVQNGNETILNTREFKYFTYYERIRKQLSQHWEPKVKEKMKKIFRQGRTIASEEDHITKLLIILNGEGNLVNVQMLGESGVQDLDDAAVEAFKSAAPFPNPPRGIIETDGTVKIRWDFVLES